MHEKFLLSTDQSDEALVERVKEQDVAAFTLRHSSEIALPPSQS